MINKTQRFVVHDYFVRDIDNINSNTNYNTLAEVKEQFNNLDCEIIVTQIKNRSVILIIKDNSILIYKYKMM